MPENKKKRWFRFSLRTLLLAITVFGIWLGIKIGAARQQKEVVADILQAGGTVDYDFQVVPDRWHPGSFCFDPNASFWEPRWLGDMLGRDFFHHVVAADLRKRSVTTDHLEQLKKLSALKLLVLSETKIRDPKTGVERCIQDADLHILRSFPNLESLSLGDSQVSNAGMTEIERLEKLKWLALDNTAIDDDGVQHLQQLHNLAALFLDGTQISDVGSACLENLTNLDWLGLVGTRVTDAGLPHFRKLSKLKQLNLRRTAVTENGARELKPFLSAQGDISVGP